MGDSADNIPGCPGVGEKTAVKLINQFGGITALLQRTDELKGALKKKVEENKEQIEFSKFLATIKTDVPIELNLDELKVKEPDEERIIEIFNDLEFKTFIQRFLNKPKPQQKSVSNQLDLFADIPDDGKETIKNGASQSLKTMVHKYELVDKEEDIKKLYDFLITNDFVSFDTETTSTNAIDAELVGLSFSVKEKEAYYVPVSSNREEAKK